MREYIKDFRMFTGKTLLITTIWGALSIIFAFAALLMVWAFAKSEAVRDFCEGYVPIFSMMFPIVGFVPCSVLFRYNRAASQGYKYFHSLPDSPVRFRRAVLASSVFSLIIVLVWAAVLLLWNTVISLFVVFVGLTISGAQHIFGHARSVIAMFIPMMAVIFSTGFFWGFMRGSENILSEEPQGAVPLAAAGAAIFVIGTIYSAAVAEKKWNRDV